MRRINLTAVMIGGLIGTIIWDIINKKIAILKNIIILFFLFLLVVVINYFSKTRQTRRLNKMKSVTLLLGIITVLLISGCTKEIIKEVPKTEYIYPQLKIADCNEMIIISPTEHLIEQWNSQNYTDWKNEYNIDQFFYLPSQCSYKHNWSSPNCSKYANAVMVYENCSIYYLNTKELYEGD